VIVEGRVDGDIYATESVSIRPSAKVKGNIFAPRVGIADGAKYSGSIDLNHKGAAAAARPATVQVALSDPAAERLLTKAG
jgi:cytoskeletal protein CcmA (bactofilin family)